MLSSPYIDDIYTTMKLTVQEPSLTINPISTQEAGIPLVVSGTTNLAVNDQLLIEISPTSFVPGDKNQQSPSSGISVTVPIASGSQTNSWPYAVGGSALKVDSYTARVAGVSVSTSVSATFDVVNSQVVVPTAPPTTSPQPTPLGISFLLGAVAVAAAALRRY